MRSILKKVSSILSFIGITFFVSCDNDNGPSFPCGRVNFGFNPSPPYENPIWHPSGDFIGFNRRPIKEINYFNGYDCPQAFYIYEEDSIGFYLINSDGSNMRRVLPYTLSVPAWSPDGTWVAFNKGAQIYIMSFSNGTFDTTSIVQLTFTGRNFFPAWSPDGKLLAFDSNVDSPTGLNFVWTMRSDGSNKKRIAFAPDEGETRMPFWTSDYDIVYQKYLPNVSTSAPEVFLIDSAGNHNTQLTDNIEWESYPMIRTDLSLLSFIQQSYTPGEGVNLFVVDLNTMSQTKLTYDGAANYSWSPDGRLVYVRFNYQKLDSIQGTLWIIDKDGSNAKQLTFNKFIVTN